MRGSSVGLVLLRIAFAEAAVDAGMVLVEADVLRTPLLEIPAEDALVEGLGFGDVGCSEFDVVDRVVLRGLAHAFLLMCWDAWMERNGDAHAKRRRTFPSV